MGEIADMMLDGTLCECCGVYIDDEHDGVPRKCAGCMSADKRDVARDKSQIKEKCRHCQRMIKKIGMRDHIRTKHIHVEKAAKW